jgi:prophage regulatory protein
MDHELAEGKANRAAGKRILRIEEAIKKVGLSRALIYRKSAAGSFPSQVRIGARATGWVEEEVDEWLARRVERGRVHRTPEPAGRA